MSILTEFKKKNHLIFPELLPFEKFGHFKLVSKISRKLFELGA